MTPAETGEDLAGHRPKVSVFVLTFNHVRWIEQALDSALAQEAPFDFELLVADDCSTDGTREIVLDYARLHPERMRTFLPERNLGIAGIWLQAARRCRGELIAILEGDDYWTSVHKLADQAAALDARAGWSSCFHRATLFHEDASQAARPATPAFAGSEFTLDDLIRACFIPFLTVMFRREVLNTVPDSLFTYRCFDWLLHIWCARRGPIGFLDDDMAAYRVHSAGNWSARDRTAQIEDDLAVYELLSRELPERQELIDLCVENRHCQLAVEAARVPAHAPVALIDAGGGMLPYFNGRPASSIRASSPPASARARSSASAVAQMRELVASGAGPGLHYRARSAPRTAGAQRGCVCVVPRSVDPALAGDPALSSALTTSGELIWSDDRCRVWEVDVDSATGTTGQDGEGTAREMGALVEIVDLARAEPLEGLDGGFLDEPRAGTVLDTRSVDVLGWALGAERRAVAAEFAIDGRVFARAPLRAERPDLASAFPDHEEAGRSGFRTTLNLIGTPAEFELQVLIVLKGQQRAPLATIRGRHRWRRDRSPAFAELVSVVIPCFEQAQYLGEAIESVLAQSYPHLEVVVVDDGSTDNASQIAARYAGVRCIREQNSGVAEARNAGIRGTNGDFLVFLDADDRLLPEAIEAGVRMLDEHPQCAAAVGAYRRTTHDGRRLDTHSQPAVDHDQYAQLMRENWAGFPARAIYRRSLLEHVRRFDPRINAAADFAFNLAVAREFPLCSHETVVAEHREHGRNISANAGRMLVETLAAMRDQRSHVRGDPELRRAYSEGMRNWKRYWGDLLVEQAAQTLREHRFRAALGELTLLLRHRPAGLARLLRSRRAQPG
jgi:glycosyltransferase involved in cell wall biosynthesis